VTHDPSNKSARLHTIASCSHSCQVLTAVLLKNQVIEDVILCQDQFLYTLGEVDQENTFFPALLDPEETTILSATHNYEPNYTA
jgi:hypothetical protein